MRNWGTFKLLSSFGLEEVLRRSIKASLEHGNAPFKVTNIQNPAGNYKRCRGKHQVKSKNTHLSPHSWHILVWGFQSNMWSSTISFFYFTSYASFTMRRGDVSEASVTSQFLLTVWNPGRYFSGEFHRCPRPTCVPLTVQPFEFHFRSSPARLTPVRRNGSFIQVIVCIWMFFLFVSSRLFKIVGALTQIAIFLFVLIKKTHQVQMVAGLRVMKGHAADSVPPCWEDVRSALVCPATLRGFL